jgi:hypothetical protein
VFVVPRPELSPGYCIVTMSSEDPGGFIDTGLSPAAVDPRIYISRQAVIDMGRHFGLPTPEQAESYIESIETMARRIEDLEHQLAEADRYAEAAEYTLKATFGDATKIRNKPGRKKVVGDA